MDDDYKRAVADLLELIGARDYLAESLKNAVPEMLSEGRRLLDAANKKIEACEAALEREYEAHQNACRAREELDASLSDIQKSMEASFIYAKHRLPPEQFGKIKAAILDNRTPAEQQEFYDRIAILEATRLEEFIGEDTTL